MTPVNSFRKEYRFLSNFWPAVVLLDGVPYSSVEHAYQASKTTDNRERALIREAATPGRAKHLGRTVTVVPYWDETKVAVMLGLVRQKFKDKELRQWLEATKDRQLIEGNRWHDNFWGICYCERCRKQNVEASNHLGKILMRIRDE